MRCKYCLKPFEEGAYDARLTCAEYTAEVLGVDKEILEVVFI